MQSEKAATFRSESLNALYNLIYSADTQQCNNCWCVIVLFKHLFYAIIISHCVLFWGGRSEEMIHIKKVVCICFTTVLLVLGYISLCFSSAYNDIYFIYSLNLSDGVKTMFNRTLWFVFVALFYWYAR